MGHPKLPTQAKPRAGIHTQQRGQQHGHYDAGGAQQRSTPSIQALAGVRVVASLLGHNRRPKKNKHALCSRAQTQVDHMDCPPCMTQGADHTNSSTPEPGMGQQQKEAPSAMSGEGQTSEGQCAIGGMQDDVKDRKTAGGASIQNTEHTSPPSPSGGTCSCVLAGPQPPGQAVILCQYIGGAKEP